MKREFSSLNSAFLRWWFYQHGRLCAKYQQNPKLAAIIGIFAVLVSALGLFNPRGKPFVFNFQEIIGDFVQYVRDYAAPRWHLAAYCVLAVYIAIAADNGVKYSTLCKIQSLLRLKASPERPKKQELDPPFTARFIVGFCGVLTVLFSIVISVAVCHSLLGVRMDFIFDELPFLIFFLGVQGVFSLLDASTVTFFQSEQRVKGEVYVVDRVNQIALATSLTGPEELCTSFAKAGFALFCCWAVGSCLGGYSQPMAAFCAHACIAALAKSLLQLSVFASIVQALVPFWDPKRATRFRTGDVKCRVCLETSLDLRRSPCRCSGSVGFIHPVCFQQWFEMKKSMRCELCHTIFQVRMLPTSVLTNGQTLQSFLGVLFPPLVWRLVLYLGLEALLLSNKLGLLAHDYIAKGLSLILCPAFYLLFRSSSASLCAMWLAPFSACQIHGGILEACWEGRETGPTPVILSALSVSALCCPALAVAIGEVLPRSLIDWSRRHRVMEWDWSGLSGESTVAVPHFAESEGEKVEGDKQSDSFVL